MPKLLPRKGPSGTYSQACRSRADQSLSTTTPNTCRRKSRTPTGSPSSEGVPTTQPSSASMSSLRLGPKLGPDLVGCLGLPTRPPEVGAGHHHRPRPSVVADRHVLPVGGQRLAAGTEDLPDVRRVVLGGVEVDVVGDLDRQVQPDGVERAEVRFEAGSARRVGDGRRQALSGLGPDDRPGGQERVEGGRLEEPWALAGRAAEAGEVDDLVPQGHTDPRWSDRLRE